MTTTPSGIIGLGDVDQLLTEINTELSVRPLMPTDCRRPGLLGPQWQQGVASIGKTSVFPVPFFGNRAKPRSIYEIPGTLPEFAKFSVSHQGVGTRCGADSALHPARRSVRHRQGQLFDDHCRARSRWRAS